MKTRLDKSIEYIKGFCEKHSNCDNCKLLSKKTGQCSLKQLPIEWEADNEAN